MFYSEVILAHKGPLGKIWLAAHLDKRLTRNQIFSTDISSAVESVLNPTSPLALRVSGHLMLGIVRIYSRKVSYLMTECKEAMWKINLAFRPGTFDIDPSFTAALNIHDARNFGNVGLETELPILENAEFPHMLLPEHDDYGSSSLRVDTSSFSMGGHTMQDYSLSAESPLMRSTSRMSRDASGSGSRLSRMGDLELTRFERGSQASQQAHRTSLASAKSGRPSEVPGGAGFDDDIPAYQETCFETDMMAQQSGMLDFGDTYVPAFEEELLPAEETKGAAGEARRGSRVSARVLEQQRREMEEEEQKAEEEEEGEEEAVAEVVAAGDQPASKKKKRATKRRRVVIDDRVELPGRLQKQRMEDRAPILRQVGTRAAPRLSTDMGSPVAAAGGIAGLCSELQEVFSMATNQAPLPFPLREGVAAPALPSAAAVGRSQQTQEDQEQVQEEYGQQDDLELTRFARDSILSGAGGRPSTLNASLGGKDGDSFTMGEGATRYSAGAGDMMEMGGFGYDDYAAGFEEPLSFRDSSVGGAEETKQGSALKRPPRRAATLTASNAISELVSATFSRGLAEQQQEEASGSRDSGSHHTRTEQFMEILEGEFQRKDKVSFEAVTGGVTKRVAAAAFLEVLQLKTWGRIGASQPAPFADIQLTRTHARAGSL